MCALTLFLPGSSNKPLIVSWQLSALTPSRIYAADKELENTVGEKERVIGAFRQHSNDHRPQPLTPEPASLIPLKNQERNPPEIGGAIICAQD